MSFRFLLVRLIFILICFRTEAQHYTPEFIDSSFEGSVILGVYEKEDQLLLAISNGLHYNNFPEADRKVVFYELIPDQSSNSFQIIEEHELLFADSYDTYALEYISGTKEWLFVQAKFEAFDKALYRVQVYDNEFNLIDQDSIFSGGVPQQFFIDSDAEQTFILGSLLPPGIKLFYAMYDHQTHNIRSPIFIGQTFPEETYFVSSMELDTIEGNMLVFYFSGIQELDTNLTQVRNFDFFSGIGTSDHGQVSRIGANYYAHGAWSIPPETSRRNIVFNKYNLEFQLMDADTLGRKGKDNYPFINHSMDFRNQHFLIGGHLSGPLDYLPYELAVKKFYLAKYTEDIELVWFHEYGGDKAYIMLGTYLLEDGTGFAYGYVTDTLSGIRYAYLLYVDENGDIISSQEIPPALGPPLTVVNPGADQLTILNPTALQARIIVSSLDGREVLNTTFQSETVSHDMQGLPSGMYPYVFYIDDRPVKSGKWVKK